MNLIQLFKKIKLLHRFVAAVHQCDTRPYPYVPGERVGRPHCIVHRPDILLDNCTSGKEAQGMAPQLES